MDKAKLAKIAENLRQIIIDIEQLDEKKAEKTEESKEISLEQVRMTFATKAVENREKVKELITKYGANKLTDINPESYKELLEEAETI